MCGAGAGARRYAVAWLKDAAACVCDAVGVAGLWWGLAAGLTCTAVIGVGFDGYDVKDMT